MGSPITPGLAPSASTVGSEPEVAGAGSCPRKGARQQSNELRKHFADFRPAATAVCSGLR
jgi:hypothetical protein